MICLQRIVQYFAELNEVEELSEAQRRITTVKGLRRANEAQLKIGLCHFRDPD